MKIFNLRKQKDNHLKTDSYPLNVTLFANKQDAIIPPPLTFVNSEGFCIDIVFVFVILFEFFVI